VQEETRKITAFVSLDELAIVNSKEMGNGFTMCHVAVLQVANHEITVNINNSLSSLQYHPHCKQEGSFVLELKKTQILFFFFCFFFFSS